MKGLSLYQPYAYAAVAGLKGNETRGHKTNIRGRVFIHAAKKPPHHVPGFHESAAILGITSISELVRGAIIGTVEIIDCVPVESIIDTITEQERLLGDYSPGRYAWILKDPRPLPYPIAAKGKQGWWNWDETEAYAPAMNEGIIALLESTGAYDGLKNPGVME